MPCRLRPCLGFVFAWPALTATFGPVSSARALTSCSYSGAKKVLTVRSTGEALSQITRERRRIIVREFLSAPVGCRGGQPTIRNTDTIVVLMRGLFPSADILLKNGPLAPGATPEPTGASEIEVRFRGADAFGEIFGTRRADEFHWGEAGGLAGLNLNPRKRSDDDIDVTAKGDFAFLVAEGAEGNDKIIPQRGTGLRQSIFSIGGPGRDTLIAPRAGGIQEGGKGDDFVLGKSGRDLLIGGPGRDRLIGAKNRDNVVGGPGRDRISAGQGRDRVRSRDRKRESVRCGPGRDLVITDKRDRLRGCERVERPDGRRRVATARTSLERRRRLDRARRARASAASLVRPHS